MERILRSVIQVGGFPEAEHALTNWHRLSEHDLEYPLEEDRKIHDYLKTFYGQMSAPPDFTLLKEYFEKKDEIETVSRLDELKKSQFYTHTNFLSIVRAEREQQSVKNVIIACRDAQQIAEHGRNLEKPVNGKKVLKGPQDAVNFLFEKMSSLTAIECGEKLEGDITEDADEVIEEYDVVSKTNKFAGRNLIGMEPVDSVCRGHKTGEFWVHTAFTGELKCVVKSTYLFDISSNERRTIGEIYKSGDLPTVMALANEGSPEGQLKLVPARVSHVVENGMQPVFELGLLSGRGVTVTGNHPFFTSRGWKKLDELVIGDFVAIPRKTEAPNPRTDFSDAEVKIVGYMLGDRLSRDGIVMSWMEPDIREDLRVLMNAIDPDLLDPRKQIGNNEIPDLNTEKIVGTPIYNLFEKLGLWNKSGENKSIPNKFFGLSDHQIELFLSRIWSTRGSGITMMSGLILKNRGRGTSQKCDIRYSSESRQFCIDIQSLLLRLGINSTVRPQNPGYENESRTDWTVSVFGNRNKREFIKRVQILGCGNLSERMIQEIPDVGDDSPFPAHLIPDGSKVQRKSTETFVYAHQSQILDKSFLELFASQDEGVKRIIDSDLLFDEVISITPKGEEMTYDVSVPVHKSLVINDIVSHNTTLALNYLYNNTYLFEKNIFYAILEMPYKQLRRQLYVLHSSHGKFITDWYAEDKRRGIPESDRYVGLDYRKVRDGELDAIGYARFLKVAQDYKATRKGRPYVWRPEAPNGDMPMVMDIRRKAEMFHNKYGCDGIVIDHLGLIRPKHRSNDFVASVNTVVQESRMLALNFARGKTVPVFALFQLNRQGKMRADKADGRYDMAAISYANEVDKSSDIITYTYLNDELRRQGKFYMGCLKNRDNPVFERMVGKVLWQTKRMRAIQTNGLIDMTLDRLKAANKAISLSSDDLLL